MLTNVWQSIDRIPFFKYAILLELKSRTQGTARKSKASQGTDRSTTTTHALYPYDIRAFLDDIALLASAYGGTDNVTAVCLEISDCNDRTIVIRLATNDGTNENTITHLNNMLSEITKAHRKSELLLPSFPSRIEF